MSRVAFCNPCEWRFVRHLLQPFPLHSNRSNYIDPNTVPPRRHGSFSSMCLWNVRRWLRALMKSMFRHNWNSSPSVYSSKLQPVKCRFKRKIWKLLIEFRFSNWIIECPSELTIQDQSPPFVSSPPKMNGVISVSECRVPQMLFTSVPLGTTKAGFVWTGAWSVVVVDGGGCGGGGGKYIGLWVIGNCGGIIGDGIPWFGNDDDDDGNPGTIPSIPYGFDGVNCCPYPDS